METRLSSRGNIKDAQGTPKKFWFYVYNLFYDDENTNTKMIALNFRTLRINELISDFVKSYE